MSNNLMPFNLSAAAVGGGVVPKPPRPDQAQADGGGLRLCEYLKRWCEQLAEENRRLGKEVAELRALNAAPAQAPPLTTLTMCLSCRRVASSSSPSNASSIPTTHAHAAANAGAGMASPAAATLPGHRQFFCGFRDAGAAAYGTSSGLAKALKAAR